MHPKFQRADESSRIAIGAAIEVHRLKGAGLIESIHEKSLMREFFLREASALQQVRVPIDCKGLVFKEPPRLDVLIEDRLVLELKRVEKILPIHKARLLDIPAGLIIHFHSLRLFDGVHRLILQGADDINEPPP